VCRVLFVSFQGAKCFDYNASLRLLVTGGRDRAVRLWTRFVTARPVATLPGHRTAVLDVAIYQPVGQIFSYSRDAVSRERLGFKYKVHLYCLFGDFFMICCEFLCQELKIWDISSHHCLKTVCLQFPCRQPGRIPEHGSFPFLLLSPPLPEQTQSHLLVGCKDHLALLNLAEARRGGGGGWSAGGGGEPGGPAITCALYNASLRQVVTGHADSSVSLWDVETGRRRLRILNAHGEDEVTCMTLDSSHRRLITGARNGTIKVNTKQPHSLPHVYQFVNEKTTPPTQVWNLLNGLNLHKLEPVTDSEVTGLTCLHNNQLLSVGWSRRVAQYDIAAAKVKLKGTLNNPQQFQINSHKTGVECISVFNI